MCRFYKQSLCILQKFLLCEPRLAPRAAKLFEINGSSRGLYLQWEGKRVYRQRVPNPRLLEPVEKYSHGTDRPNMLIEGDNLQVLASLKARYTGLIDVIYIDPPVICGCFGFFTVRVIEADFLR